MIVNVCYATNQCSLIFINFISRCFGVFKHRDLHIAAETIQPGDICGFTRVGGW